MKQFNYTPNLTDLIILKTEQSQFEQFFYKGHPEFLIPDFSDEETDIWISFMDYLENKYNLEIYDQEGGEITSHNIIDPITGLTKCTYEAYGITFNEDDEMKDIKVEIEGYVVQNKDNTYFAATKVLEYSNYNE